MRAQLRKKDGELYMPMRFEKHDFAPRESDYASIRSAVSVRAR